MMTNRNEHALQGDSYLDVAVLLTYFSFVAPCLANIGAVLLGFSALRSGIGRIFIPAVLAILIANACLFCFYATMIKNIFF